jgi:hypothetical protein
MRARRQMIETTLAGADELDAAQWRNSTPAECVAAVEALREGYFALHGRRPGEVARVLVVADFPPSRPARRRAK